MMTYIKLLKFKKMKNTLCIFVLLVFSYQINAKEKIAIAALKTVELSYPYFADFDISLQNNSGKQIQVTVLNPTTREQIKGFGLGPMGKVVLSVGKGNILVLKNNSTKAVSITLDSVPREVEVKNQSASTRISFTLHNASLKSIPLIIPNVMNPKLSPISNSGVSLKMGQKIYYKKRGKKKLLLIVDDKIKAGDKIDVAKLIADLEKDS
jgi:hypothetical protein